MSLNAQDTSICPTFVQTAIESAQVACDDIQVSQACFGHANVRAKFYPQISEYETQVVGNYTDTRNIAILQTSVADVMRGEWGISRLDIEAVNSNTSDDNAATLLLFGDVEIVNKFEFNSLEGTINASINVNVRASPSASGSIIKGIAPHTTIGIIGRNYDGTWLRIRSDDIEGWVLQDFVIFDGDKPREETIPLLTDLTQRDIFYDSMQAFVMRSSDHFSSCSEVPQNGLIIQTHTRDSQIKFLLNEVTIMFDSTIHLQTKKQADNLNLIITTLEGETQIESNNVFQSAQSGQSIFVELDENNVAIGIPSEPKPLEPLAVDALPTNLLPRNICIPSPYHPPPNTSTSLTTNLTGVNLDELEPLGTPNPELLGDLGWIRLPYNVSNGTGSLDVEEAYVRYQPLIEEYVNNGFKTILVLTHQTYGEAQEEFLPWSEMTDSKWRLLSDELAIMACQIAKQYAEQGIVTVYQIWNEQDAPIGARASVGMSNENYAYMVTRVAQAIRAADRNALIITGGYVGGPGLGAEHARRMTRLLPTTDLIDGNCITPLWTWCRLQFSIPSLWPYRCLYTSIQ